MQGAKPQQTNKQKRKQNTQQTTWKTMVGFFLQFDAWNVIGLWGNKS